jgi:sugar-specific transcriptional regulator TrmB
MNELITKLKSLGFTEYESKIFLALLQGHLMSATEIAESAKIRRTDVYNVLKSFVEKGYCNEIETNTIMKYEMIDPDVILDKIEHKIQKEKEKQVASFKDAFKSLKPLYRTKENEKDKISNIELIRGYNQHREEKFINLLKSAKKEILFMIRLEIYISDDVDSTAEKFIKNGGVIKSIYEVGNNFKVKKEGKWTEGNVNDLVKVFSKFEKYGEQLKLSNVKIPNFTVFDRETVFMNIVDKTLPRYNEADIIIRNKDYAESMVEVFNSFWEKSSRLKEYKKIK